MTSLPPLELLPLELLTRNSPVVIVLQTNRYQQWWGGSASLTMFKLIMDDKDPTTDFVEAGFEAVESLDNEGEGMLFLVSELLNNVTAKRMFLNRLHEDGGWGKGVRQVLTEERFREHSDILIAQQRGILVRGNKALEQFGVRLAWDEYSCLCLVPLPAVE